MVTLSSVPVLGCKESKSQFFGLNFRLTITQNFYHLLIDTFQGEAGLTRVLNGQFMVLNEFNEVPLTKNSWRAGIQPKSRVAMAIMLKPSEVRSGRCANPSCSGRIDFGTDQVTRIWYAGNPC
jgi:Ubiquitin-like domain